MKRLVVILLVLAAAACNKDDDPKKYSSFEGYWIVDTPDQQSSVAFRITRDPSDQFVVDNVSVRHLGNFYNSRPVNAGMTATSDTSIESITLLTTVNEVPFFVIRFLDISVTSDFTEMTITNSIFNIDGQYREFQSLQATR